MILVLPDLEILQDQNLIKNLSLKTAEEKVPSIKGPIQNLRRNRSRKVQEALMAPMMILTQNLKENLISRIKVRVLRKKSFGRPKRGGKNFDTRDKYERGSLKYGRRPSANGEERREDKTKSFVQKRRLNKIDKDIHKDSIRLNKYIANSGICSRREADELITQGLVEVNGKVVTEMGYQVQKTDRVVFDGQSITPEKPVYVLLNKPKGYISTTKDDKARKTVMDLVANASPYRLFPVGRLDRSTTGVILLTNDGHMTKNLRIHLLMPRRFTM